MQDHKLDNEKIFDSLEPNDTWRNWISLKLDGEKVKIFPVVSTIALNNEKDTIEILTDHEGRLLGYFGYAMLSKEIQSLNHPDEKDAEYANLPLLKMDESQRTLPSQDMEYFGKFYYHYTQKPVESLEGSVSARYNHSDKKIGINITGQNREFWEVKDSLNNHTVNVQNDGTIFGRV
ncbi:MAG: hypothetical protein SOS93_04770 [Mannheimia varigena]|nr:hypothetical protein [Mannheimia varigena]